MTTIEDYLDSIEKSVRNGISRAQDGLDVTDQLDDILTELLVVKEECRELDKILQRRDLLGAFKLLGRWGAPEGGI